MTWFLFVCLVGAASAAAQLSPREFPTPLVAKFRSVATTQFGISHTPSSYNEILQRAHTVGGVDVFRGPEFYRQVDLYLELHEREFGAQSTMTSWLLGGVQSLRDPASLPMFKRIAEKPESNLAEFAAISVAIIAPDDEFFSEFVRSKVEESIRNESPAPSHYFAWLPVDEAVEHSEAIAADARAKIERLPDGPAPDVAERRRFLEGRLVSGGREAERHRWLETDEPDVVMARLIGIWSGSARGHVDRDRALQTLRRRGLEERFAEAVRRFADEGDDSRPVGTLFRAIDELGVVLTPEDYARMGQAASPAVAPQE